jgi:hypothetical protein
MLRGKAAATAILAMTATATVQAAAPVVQPIQYGRETVRYVQGQPTLDVRGKSGVVQITPLPMDHGCVTFGIVVFNDSGRAADIDIRDVTATIGDRPGVVLTAQQLQSRAGNRAFWTSVAIAAVAGVAAGVASANNSHYTVRTRTPHGSYVSKASYHSASDAVNGAIIAGGGAAAIGTVQQKLDATRAEIGENVLQLTTVEPGDSYGGRVVIDKLKGQLPQTINLTVAWNGENYTTRWQVAPHGTPTPVYTTPAEASAEVEATSRQGRIEPAVVRVEHGADQRPKPVAAVATTRPKRYPQDDTVQVPM